MALTNGEIASILERHGKLLEVAGESPFRTRAYERAADAIRLYPERLSDLRSTEELRRIPGVGEGIASTIAEVLSSGTFATHKSLTARYPESLITLVEIPGVGPKTARKLFDAGIATIEDLDAALAANSFGNTKGLGPRLAATLREGLDAIRRRTGRTPLGTARPVALAFLRSYSELRPHDRISLAGSARRWDVTVNDLNLLVAGGSVDETLDAVSALAMVSEVERIDDSAARVQLAAGLAATVEVTDLEAWGPALIRATGNAAHVTRLGALPDIGRTEEEVYEALGLPWIPPELRAGNLEFVRWQELPLLIQQSDYRGELHTHTTWSDGKASIKEMAEAAEARGYAFLGITDHSHGLGVAGGLDVDRLSQQRAALKAAADDTSVRLLAGAEVEVLRDGALDYDNQTLAALDVVVASLHTGLRQPREQLTSRLISVLENANVDIIAHPSGRIIERRESGDFDWDRAFSVASRTQTALEINADPARLDLDPHLALRASDAGCRFTINSDAHAPAGFDLIEFGIMMARKAWLRPEQVINCWPTEELLAWLESRGGH